MKPTIKISVDTSGQHAMAKGMKALTQKQVYVGVPEANAQRKDDLMKSLAKGVTKKKMIKAASVMINNAQLIYIHTHGSPLKHIPARPVIEAAIEDSINMALIMEPFEKAAQAALDGKPEEVDHWLQLAGQLAENLVKAWFTNPRNHWAPNAPSTIARKGSDKPLINYGEMRKAITHILAEDNNE